MSRRQPNTPYRDGYLAGLANKVKAAPQALNTAQRKVWDSGYDDALRAGSPRPSLHR